MNKERKKRLARQRAGYNAGVEPKLPPPPPSHCVGLKCRFVVYIGTSTGASVWRTFAPHTAPATLWILTANPAPCLPIRSRIYLFSDPSTIPGFELVEVVRVWFQTCLLRGSLGTRCSRYVRHFQVNRAGVHTTEPIALKPGKAALGFVTFRSRISLRRVA